MSSSVLYCLQKVGYIKLRKNCSIYNNYPYETVSVDEINIRYVVVDPILLTTFPLKLSGT